MVLSTGDDASVAPRRANLVTSGCEVLVLGVLRDELRHVPALRHDSALRRACLVEREAHELGAQALPPMRSRDLGMGEDHRVADHSILGDADQLVVDRQLVPALHVIVPHLGGHVGLLPACAVVCTHARTPLGRDAPATRASRRGNIADAWRTEGHAAVTEEPGSTASKFVCFPAVAVVLGFFVAVAFGTGDFIGGRASMRASTVAVLVASHAIGVAGALVMALFVGARVALHDVAYGAGAGAVTVVGLGLLYQGLATAAMGVVAPVTAVVGAIVPITWGVAHGERPSALATSGIVLAVAAGALIAREPGRRTEAGTATIAPGIAIAVASGIALGSSLVFFSETSPASGMWPVLFGRAAGLMVALAGASWLFTRRTLAVPRGESLAFAIVAGVLDVAATSLLLLAVRRGLISVVAGLAAFAPGFTVLWAYVVLHEHLRADQRVAIVLALVGLVLVAAG